MGRGRLLDPPLNAKKDVPHVIRCHHITSTCGLRFYVSVSDLILSTMSQAKVSFDVVKKTSSNQKPQIIAISHI